MTARRRVLTTAPGTRPGAYGPTEWGLLVVVALVWGSAFLWIAEGLETFSPPVVTLGRLVLGAASLALFPRTRTPVERVDWPHIVVLALVWMAIPLLLFPIAQQWVDSSIAGAINGGLPLFTAGLAAILLRKPPGPAQVAGLLVGFSGVMLVTLAGATGASGSPLGIGMLVGATILYSIAYNLAVPLVQKYGSLPVLLRSQLVAIAVVLPFGLAGLPSSRWSWSSGVAVLLLGVFCTGVAFVASTALSSRVGATRGSLPIYFLPVVAMVLGTTVRGEVLHAAAVVGVGLVIGGAWLSSRRES